MSEVPLYTYISLCYITIPVDLLESRGQRSSVQYLLLLFVCAFEHTDIEILNPHCAGGPVIAVARCLQTRISGLYDIIYQEGSLCIYLCSLGAQILPLIWMVYFTYTFCSSFMPKLSSWPRLPFTYLSAPNCLPLPTQFCSPPAFFTKPAPPLHF